MGRYSKARGQNDQKLRREKPSLQDAQDRPQGTSEPIQALEGGWDKTLKALLLLKAFRKLQDGCWGSLLLDLTPVSFDVLL